MKHIVELKPIKVSKSPKTKTVQPVAVPKPKPKVIAGGVMGLAQSAAAAKGWIGAEWNALRELVQRESGWNPNAINPSSGACGLFQALPCSKMGGMEIGNQIRWGLNYIAERYGSPSSALAHHDANNWY